MVEIEPVRLYYPNPNVVRPDDVVCPVYDTLSREERARYAHRPFNAARFVTRPVDVTVEAFVAEARAELARALGAGAYRADEAAGLYIYGLEYEAPPELAETYEAKERREAYLLLGLVAAVRIDSPTSESVAPHERTFPDRVDERVRLFRATGVQFAPIVAGYSMPDHAVNDRLESYLGVDRRRLRLRSVRPPLVSARLGRGRHSLWRIDDPELAADLRATMRRTRLLLLDGHHRYTAAVRGASPDRPRYPLVMMVESRDRALHLRPWHRWVGPHSLTDRPVRGAPIDPLWTLRELAAPTTVESALALQAEIPRGERAGFVAFDRHRALVVSAPRHGGPRDDYEILHGWLAQSWRLAPIKAEPVRSPREAFERVAHEQGTAFLLPPTTVEAIERLAFDERGTMAEKSTLFWPKVVDGLLFAPAPDRPPAGA